MQRLVVLAQQMLRHMNRHRDARRIRSLRELPLQLTQSNCADGLKLPRLLLLKPRDHFIDVRRGQIEMQSLVVLAQHMLRHTDRHRDTRLMEVSMSS